MGLIYKYRECNKYTKAIFITGCLHYSHPDNFNDPYDSKLLLGKKKLYVYLMRVGENKLRLVPIDVSLLQKFMQNEVNDVEICSFSKTGQEMLMWSHYAADHSGLCLEFDEELLLERQHCDAREVDYLPEQVVNEDILPEEMVEASIKFLYTKKSVWSYEQEVRYFHKPDPNYTNGNYPFNKQALKSIYFGNKCSKRNIAIYKNLCKRNGFEHVKFYRIELANDGTFDLVPRLLE